MPPITIDGKEYDTDKLSEEARNQLIFIQFVDRKIQELQSQCIILAHFPLFSVVTVREKHTP